MRRLSLKVVPGSSRDEVVGWLGDSLKVKVKVKEPPEKGRANEAVVAVLAERLGVNASTISSVSTAGRQRALGTGQLRGEKRVGNHNHK